MSDALILWISGILVFIAASAYVSMLFVFNKGLIRLERMRKAQGSTVPATFISVMIPARNEQKNIECCLRDLLMQSYPKNLFEVIVVDDHSEDETAAMTEAFADTHPEFSLRLLKNPDGLCSKKQALTTGVMVATGELIVITDADCRNGQGWLQAFASCYQVQKPGLILGPVTLADNATFTGRMQALEFLSLVASGAGMAGAGHPILANGANMAFSREKFLALGEASFRPEFASGDDVFLLRAFAERYGKGSISYLYDEQALVSTHPVKTLREFLHQRMRWVSKARGYRRGYLPLIAMNVLFFQIVLLAVTVFTFINCRAAAFPLICIMVKSLCDIPLLLRITGFTGQRYLMKYFPAVQLLYPFYVLFTAIAGLTGTFKWKGRKYPA